MLPIVVSPPENAAERPPLLAAWLAENTSRWQLPLDSHGAVVLRGFDVPGAAGFAEVSRVLFGTPAAYVYRSTPRTEVGQGVYTATEYPAKVVIPQHSENAYAREWPTHLAFYCGVAPARGGETPLSDNRVTTAKIPTPIRDRFEKTGVLYVRNYGAGVDLPWQVVFQTESRAEVEAFCQARDIAFEWRADRLRTRQTSPALVAHPRTGERLWFNQAHLFHPSNLDPKTREALLGLFGREDLPRNAYYGDGAEIEADALEAIRRAYGEATTASPWRESDVVVVDNVRVGHGRRPFEGPRKVLVSMGSVSS